MTGPDSTTTSTSQDGDSQEAADRGSDASTQEDGGLQAASESELAELAGTQENVAQRARQLVAGELATHARDGETDDQHVHRLLTSTRADLLAELHQQEQARRQLAQATRGSEEAVAGVVQGITTIVRSIVPPALVRPEDVIEATYALADQGLRVGRRLALTLTSNVRSLTRVA